MGAAVIGAAGLILVAALTGAFQYFAGRNERAEAHQEVDLLAKLDPNSEAAKALSDVIEARIARWRDRMFKQPNPMLVRGSKRYPRWFFRFQMFVYAYSFAFALAIVIGIATGYVKVGP